MIKQPLTLEEAEYKMKKRESLYLLPVPLVEALELPIGVERTTQKPHAEHVYQHRNITLTRSYDCVYTIRSGIYRCLILDSNVKFSRFQQAKKERLVNAIHKCKLTLPHNPN